MTTSVTPLFSNSECYYWVLCTREPDHSIRKVWVVLNGQLKWCFVRSIDPLVRTVIALCFGALRKNSAKA